MAPSRRWTVLIFKIPASRHLAQAGTVMPDGLVFPLQGAGHYYYYYYLCIVQNAMPSPPALSLGRLERSNQPAPSGCHPSLGTRRAVGQGGPAGLFPGVSPVPQPPAVPSARVGPRRPLALGGKEDGACSPGTREPPSAPAPQPSAPRAPLSYSRQQR